MKKITPEGGGIESPSRAKYYPSFRLKLKDIPEAKNWKVGKNYRLNIETTMTSIRESEETAEVGFDIKGVESMKENKKNLKGEFTNLIKRQNKYAS